MITSEDRPEDKTQPFFPLAGGATDGYSTKDEATATCYCGAVQLAFPINGPGLGKSFTCHCFDCRKITASMFATNFFVSNDSLFHIRGQSNLSIFSQSKTIGSGKTMSNYFCKTCGTLMYRVGERFPGKSILRVGTVDDVRLMEGKLKPVVEAYPKDRVSWLKPIEGL